ncbi:11653_t:CDS:2 [Cetraspora pellucida]|uniref:11653_t:CDS:1 n=1 Tax=Cetraspora pellucida TaxID=1433469 RepID=A0ACA9N8V2_9GLOM|nr:11653_t:CDS:2 [Cetraspora pellucida]
MTVQEKLTPYIVCNVKSARKILMKWVTCQNILIVILIAEFIICSIILWINKLKHSYLYTDPYEPIVHGTFGVDQTELWNIFIIRNIKELIQISEDFFNVVIIRSHGFGHPDYDGLVPI